MIRVGVFGALGRMGRTVCEAVDADPDLELVARVDISDDREEMVRTGAEVAVDFTLPGAVMDNVAFCVSKGIHCVVGTTGLTDDKLGEIEKIASGASANVFVAPNFSIGAVLMMRFAQQAAPYFGSAEVIEYHHNAKLDAPSGTAMRTAGLIARSWKDRGRPAGGEPAAGEKETVSGARGADVDGVHVHGVRLRGPFAHQDVLFGGPGEGLTIRHLSYDRESYMPGVLLAVKSIAARPGLTVGLENLLDL